MKKIFFILLSSLLFFVAYFEDRDFVCSRGKCVTDWKTYGRNRYIIPGKYYGLLKPSNLDNYVKAKYHSSGIVIIWKNDSDTLLAQKDTDDLIFNNNKNKAFIIDYNSDKRHYDSLYTYYDKKLHLTLFKTHVTRVGIPLDDLGAL